VGHISQHYAVNQCLRHFCFLRNRVHRAIAERSTHRYTFSLSHRLTFRICAHERISTYKLRGEALMLEDVERFNAVAAAFCEFMESAHTYDLLQRATLAAALLAELYSAALHLPALTIAEAYHGEPETIPLLEGWNGFGSLTLYWKLPQAFEWDAPINSSLSEDLIDIYRDVKRGVLRYQRGDLQAQQSAVVEWRRDFASHWGTHAVECLRALHHAQQKAL